MPPRGYRKPESLKQDLVKAEIAQRQAAAAEHTAKAVREAGLFAIEGGLITGLGVWVHERVRRPTLTNDNLTRGSLALPGVKQWIADQVGLIVGTPLAQALPAHLHDNGDFLADKWLQAGINPLNKEGAAIVEQDIAREGWFEAVIEQIAPIVETRRRTQEEIEEAVRAARAGGATPEEIRKLRDELSKPYTVNIPQFELRGVHLSESTALMITAAAALGFVGLIEMGKAAGKKAGGG